MASNKIWLISRLDQASILASGLNRASMLAQWDSFIRLNSEGYLAQKFFAGSRRMVSPDLSKKRGSHFLPEFMYRAIAPANKTAASISADIALAFLARLSPPAEFNILHGQGNYSLEAARYALQQGKIFVSDVSGQMEETRKSQLGHVYKAHQEKLHVGIPLLQRRRLKEAQIATAIICPADSVKLELARLGIDESKIYIAQYDAPLARTICEKKFPTKAKNSCEELNLLFAGRISMAKGVHDLIRLQDLLRANSVKSKLHLVGENVGERHFLQHIHRNDIIFHNKLPPEKLIEQYRNADLFLFPSYSEGSALVTHEAMAAGLPTIASLAAGAPIQHGTNGYLFKPGDVNALYKIVIELAQKPEKRYEIGQAGQKTIQNSLREGYCNRVINIYDQIFEQHQASSTKK